MNDDMEDTSYVNVSDLIKENLALRVRCEELEKYSELQADDNIHKVLQYADLMTDALKIVEEAKGCVCSGDVLNAVDVWCEKYGDRA